MLRRERVRNLELGLGRRIAHQWMRWGIVASLLTVGACQCREQKPDIKHVIIISIDTLRADFLGTYGHPFVKSPVIDGLAEEGVVFEKHMASAPTTLASHTSLMAGVWPHTHGVPRNGFLVPLENVMLPEVLKDNGFRTAGFIGGYPLKKRYQFNQGIDHYDERMDKRAEGIAVYGSQRSAKNIANALNKYLGANPLGEEENLFLFLHFFDVHAPYMPPEPYDTMYVDDTLDVTGTLQDVGRISAALKKNHPEAKAKSDVLERLYAGEVSYVDHQLGRIFRMLKEHGVYDDALIVLTSDHGETMAEHVPSEVWDHGYTLFDATIRTPLIMRFPKGQYGGKRSNVLLSNVDVMPTILDFLEMDVPPAVEGFSFAGIMTNEPYNQREQAFSEATKPSTTRFEKNTVWRNERKHRSLRTDDERFIYRPLSKRSSLYRFDGGYFEGRDRLRSNIDPADKEASTKFMAELEKWHAKAKPAISEEDQSSESAKMLEALGYVDEEPSGRE